MTAPAIPTSEQLRRWRASAVAFCQEACWAARPDTGEWGPLRLQPHQRSWIATATKTDRAGLPRYRVAVASWPKREGKSLCVALLVAWRLVTRENERIGILANSERQAASNVYEHVAALFRNSPLLRSFVSGDDIQTRRLTVRALSNVLECYPCNERTIQGVGFTCLASDELHAAESTKPFAFASAQTEAQGAQVLIASQAGSPSDSNPLWRLYSERKASHVFFDYRTALATPWAKQRAKEAKLEGLPAEWSYMWENSWGAAGVKLFSSSDVMKAATGARPPRTAAEWNALRNEWTAKGSRVLLGVGLDRAGVSRGGDRTVWTVVAKVVPPRADQGEPQYHVLRCSVLPTGAEAEILAEAADTAAVFGHGPRIMCESYNCSDIVEKLAGAELGVPTTQTQQRLFNRLYRAITDGRLTYPAGIGESAAHGARDILRRELLAFEHDLERASLPKFGTQRGEHDDAVYSLAWACEAAERPQAQLMTWATRQKRRGHQRGGPIPPQRMHELIAQGKAKRQAAIDAGRPPESVGIITSGAKIHEIE